MNLTPPPLHRIQRFTLTDHRLRVLLIERANKPAPGGRALPGSVLKRDLDRNVDDAALRALAIKCA